MNREDRLKAMWENAIPDHRLMPDVVERLKKLPRNARRVQKRIIEGSLRTVYGRILACQESGAGFLIDKQLREYLIEYNDRVMGHGLLTLPMSFNDTEGFYVFNEKPTPHFLIRPEKDHLFSFGDFLDFATEPGRTQNAAIDGLKALPEGIVHSYTPLGDVHDTAFLHSDSGSFVMGGFTLVKLGQEVNWLMLGGPICNLTTATEEVRKQGLDLSARPAEKRFIDVAEGLEMRAEPLIGCDDVWKTVLMGRFNLSTLRVDGRFVAIDHGNHYDSFCDDPGIFQKTSIESLNDHERQVMSNMAGRLAEYSLQFEIASTCFLLPTYFSHRITLVRETSRPTKLAHADRNIHAAVAALPEASRPILRRVASLEVVDVSKTPAIRSYRPPSYKVEVDGFWRRLTPGQTGRDQQGNPILGRTWVKGHLRWRDLPERRSTIFVKSTIASAKARAAALIASDRSVTTINSEMSALPEDNHTQEPQTSSHLYVMRCPLMDDDVYKVGWTSKEPRERAEELSRATGVPLAFVVVEAWATDEPRLIEGMAHMALSEFRISARREFFKAPFDVIRRRIVDVFASRQAAQ